MLKYLLITLAFTASVAAQKSVPYIDTVGDTLRWPAGEWIVPFTGLKTSHLVRVDSCWYEPTPCPDPDYYPGGGCLVLHVEKKCKPVGPDTTRFYAKVDTVIEEQWDSCGPWPVVTLGGDTSFMFPVSGVSQLVRVTVLDTIWLPKVQVWLTPEESAMLRGAVRRWWSGQSCGLTNEQMVKLMELLE